MKTNNGYLKNIAKNTGSDDTAGTHTDNYYLKRIDKNIEDGGGGVTPDLKDYIKKSDTAGLVKNDGTIDTTQYVSDISGKADKTDFDTVTATITYTNNTSETVEFYIVPSGG